MSPRSRVLPVAWYQSSNSGLRPFTLFQVGADRSRAGFADQSLNPAKTAGETLTLVPIRAPPASR